MIETFIAIELIHEAKDKAAAVIRDGVANSNRGLIGAITERDWIFLLLKLKCLSNRFPNSRHTRFHSAVELVIGVNS